MRSKISTTQMVLNKLSLKAQGEGGAGKTNTQREHILSIICILDSGIFWFSHANAALFTQSTFLWSNTPPADVA